MNQETFKCTVFCLKDEMFRFARRFLDSAEESEDVVQDLMIKMWQMKDTLANLNIKSYVMKAVKNECLNRLKHHEVKKNFVKMQMYNSATYKTEINNLQEQIIKFINQLPEKQKIVIHLKDVEDYDIAEISEIMQIEENAVRVNLMRARTKIKEQITQLMDYEKRQISG